MNKLTKALLTVAIATAPGLASFAVAATSSDVAGWRTNKVDVASVACSGVQPGRPCFIIATADSWKLYSTPASVTNGKNPF